MCGLVRFDVSTAVSLWKDVFRPVPLARVKEPGKSSGFHQSSHWRFSVKLRNSLIRMNMEEEKKILETALLCAREPSRFRTCEACSTAMHEAGKSVLTGSGR